MRKDVNYSEAYESKGAIKDGLWQTPISPTPEFFVLRLCSWDI